MFQNKLILQYQICITFPICIIISGFGSNFPSCVLQVTCIGGKWENTKSLLTIYLHIGDSILWSQLVMNWSISSSHLMEPPLFPTQRRTKFSPQPLPHFCMIPTVLFSQLCLGPLSSLSSRFNNHTLCKVILLSHGGNMASPSDWGFTWLRFFRAFSSVVRQMPG